MNFSYFIVWQKHLSAMQTGLILYSVSYDSLVDRAAIPMH